MESTPLQVRAPSGPEWVHEIKFDGYRIQVHRRAEDTRVLTNPKATWVNPVYDAEVTHQYDRGWAPAERGVQGFARA